MDLQEYISEVKPLTGSILAIQKSEHELDKLTKFFFNIMMRRHTISAYDLWIFIQKEKHPSWIKPIAYKNVLKRVRKLFQLGFIEEVKREGGYKHGARKYKVSALGLIYGWSQKLGSPTEFIKSHSDSFMMRTFIHPLFERETLQHSTFYLDVHIVRFLSQVCSVTAEELSMVHGLHESDSASKWMLELLEFNLNRLIKEFLIRLSLGPGHFKSKSLQQKILEPDYTTVKGKKISTFDLISKDKKFMAALEDVSKEFFNGYNTLMKLKNQNT
jgi:hypothetical protein